MKKNSTVEQGIKQSWNECWEADHLGILTSPFPLPLVPSCARWTRVDSGMPTIHCPRGYCAPCLTTVWSSHSLERALIPSGSGAPLVLLWNHSVWTDSKSFLWKDIYVFPHNRINSRNFFKARTNFFSSLFQMNKPRQRSCVSWLKPHMESHSLGIKITDNHFLFFLSI